MSKNSEESFKYISDIQQGYTQPATDEASDIAEDFYKLKINLKTNYNKLDNSNSLQAYFNNRSNNIIYVNVIFFSYFRILLFVARVLLILPCILVNVSKRLFLLLPSICQLEFC